LLSLAAITLTLVGCARNDHAVAVTRGDSLKSAVGQRVSLVGVAEPRKLGAALRGADFYVWVDGLLDWPPGYVGQKVEVIGVLEERHDLPVFVADTPEERMRVQGTPVPSGTDLKAASRRYVVRDATWSVLR
jgi:hypothetical protein